MEKFLKISGSLGLFGLSALLVKEKIRYDSLPDKSKYTFFSYESAPETKWNAVGPQSLPAELWTGRSMLEESVLSGIFGDDPPKMVDTWFDESELSDGNGQPLDMSHYLVEDLGKAPKVDAEEAETTVGLGDGMEIAHSSVVEPEVNQEIIEASSVVPNPVVEVEEVKMQPIVDLAVESVHKVEVDEAKDKDDDVIDIKVAFSNEKQEKVLDPKYDFLSQEMVFGENSTLNALSKRCMELGIILGDLMADVPAPRLDQVYKELQNLFKEVSNLQKEQDVIISRALHEQGSEFSQVLEQQWEASVSSMAAQMQELEKDYSEKLNEFKISYKNQLLQEESEKLENLRKEYEMDKSFALSNQEQQLVQKWEAIVSDKVDQERDGRLAKLDHLAVKVQVLQNATQDIASRLEHKYNLEKLEMALEKLSAAVMESPRSIEKEFNNLWLIGSKYPFVSNILSSLPKDIAVSGVTECNELKNSFQNTRWDIWRIQYMPENGGPLSYLISFFGPQTEIGKITGEVLRNSSEAMMNENGDIDSAARQLNRLRGWQRVLALDWLSNARRYLELKQALDIMQAYVRLEKLEVI